MSEKSKRRFDKNRQQIDFYPGDLVYLRKPNRKVRLSEKLLPQYSGPWEIVMKTAPNNYQITNHSKKKMDIVNVERLKKFNKRVDEPIDDIDLLQVEFAPEIEVINDQGDRKLEILQDEDENSYYKETTEKFIDDNDQISLKLLFEPEKMKEKEKLNEKERITLKHAAFPIYHRVNPILRSDVHSSEATWFLKCCTQAVSLLERVVYCRVFVFIYLTIEALVPLGFLTKFSVQILGNKDVARKR
uniref:Tf2-1-like SH3-like domain-containing protein n=1 Tax=Strigamia maritima TaxID=126957 RepID=T1JEI2_STRMM